MGLIVLKKNKNGWLTEDIFSANKLIMLLVPEERAVLIKDFSTKEWIAKVVPNASSKFKSDFTFCEKGKGKHLYYNISFLIVGDVIDCSKATYIAKQFFFKQRAKFQVVEITDTEIKINKL